MQYVVGVLMLMTIGVLTWHHYGMESVLELSAKNPYSVELLDDRAAGGNSVGTLERSPGVLKMKCLIGNNFAYPYCKYRFHLGTGTKGVDLSRFDSMSFDLSYTSPATPSLVRVFIRNFEPSVSTVEDSESQKINEITFPAPVSGRVAYPMKVFRTALWWVEGRNVPLISSDVRMDNVTTVDISTGTSAAGAHNINLRAVKLHGKWISQNHLLIILIGVWIACGVIWPALGALHFRAQLQTSTTRLAMLSSVNHALELEAHELANQAYHDPLTGALNRQGLRDALMKSWDKSSMLVGAMSVLFLDLDHFKRVNDTFGHEVGDEVLRRFSAMIQAEIRGTDKLVRWGGEEFLIICQNTSTVQAQVLAGKLRIAMAKQAWPHDLKMTSSFGVTALYNGEEIVEAIKRADGALYKAKANGRDCVEVA